MAAIYKKEMRAYFTSIIGYLFFMFLLVFAGIYHYIYNFVFGYANFAYVLSGTSTFFLLLVPMLTMRIVAEEKRQKTDQLLYTSPVSITKIVVGKYLALATVFFLAMCVLSIYPLVLRTFGDTNLKIAYATIAAFFLLGCAYMAIGMYISSLTESQVFAAVLTFIVMLFTWLVDLLAGMLPSNSLTSFLVFSVCIVILAVVLYLMMHHVAVSFAVGGVAEAMLLGVFLLRPEWLEGAVYEVAGWFSVLARFENFRFGIFSLSAYIYYLSLIVLFVFLTVQAIKKRRWS